jgi:hypothetical protein
MANDLEVLFQYETLINKNAKAFLFIKPYFNKKIKNFFIYETDNIDQVESCIKTYMKKAQYRKYKEVYQVDLEQCVF